MGNAHPYTKGDWIVHSHYGVGQIVGTELKSISGKDTEYFRIKGIKSTFWMPVDQMGSDVIRSLSTSEDIQQVIATLQKPPLQMSSNYKKRRKRIQNAHTKNTLHAAAKILRDLSARRRKKGPLNTTERGAFRTLKKRLVTEWAIVTGAETEEVATRLDNLLNH